MAPSCFTIMLLWRPMLVLLTYIKFSQIVATCHQWQVERLRTHVPFDDPRSVTRMAKCGVPYPTASNEHWTWPGPRLVARRLPV